MKILCYLLLVSFLSISFISCETEADIKLPETSPKLVVISYISPQDTVIRVRVTLSVPIFGKTDISKNDGEIKAVDDASVIISDGVSSVPLRFDETGDLYVLDASLIRIEAEKTYFLSVSTPDGLKVNAQCTVPQQNNTVVIESVDSIFYPERKTYNASFRWEDNPAEINYYRIWAEVEHRSRYISKSALYFSEEDRFISDFDASSSTFRRKGEFTHSLSVYLKKISGYLVATDIHYYKYHQALLSADRENIFSEPTLMYSNINEGFGVFCAYNKSNEILIYL